MWWVMPVPHVDVIISGLPEVQVGKDANISEAVEGDRVVPKEVDNHQGTRSQPEPEDERCQDWTQHLIDQVHLNKDSFIFNKNVC